MSTDAQIAVFVDKALAAGIPHDAVVKLLAAHGWPERDIYDALGGHYQRLIGMEIPRRAGVAVSAKEAFYYLLTFSTLATWTVAYGCLSFALINRWLADPLFSSSFSPYDTYIITSSMAAILVAFPLYLLISRTVLVESAAQPERLDSSVRKWLTYMALVIAASIFMGDLITALTYLLRGEFTSRFIAKSLVVLSLSGGVFFYYFGGLRKTDVAAKPGRDRLMAWVSTAAVGLILALGFVQSGRPSAQRQMRADAERTRHLFELAIQVQGYWNTHGSQLPQSINEINNANVDPVTHAPYEYHAGQRSRYELCANFARGSDPRQAAAVTPSPWIHPAGRHCFAMDATGQLQGAPWYPGD